MLKKYGFTGSIKLIISLLYTKLFFKNARLVRLPFDIRNKKNIKIGTNFTTGFGCRIEAYPLNKDNTNCIIIGNNVQINDYVHIAAVESIVIEDNVLMASKIYISDHNHGDYETVNSDSPITLPIERKLFFKPILIEQNVWLGESVCVLQGVTIGKGSIIGALSVVTKNIPPYCIAVGNPAKVIKEYDFITKRWLKKI